jgi:hypothetical protein
MTHEVPRSSLRQYSVARALTARCLDNFFRTRQDADGSEVFAIEDLVGDVAVDARALATGKDEMLYRFKSESNRQASERDSSHAAPASWDACLKVLPLHYALWKNVTPDAPYA